MSGWLVRDHLPAGLEEELKAGRLDLLAFFRAIDRLPMDARELPQPVLNELFELDGDYAQALGALDEAAVRINIRRMMRDTRRSLGRLAKTRSRFLDSLPAWRRTRGTRSPERTRWPASRSKTEEAACRRVRRLMSEEEWIAEVCTLVRGSVRRRLGHLGLREMASLDRGG